MVARDPPALISTTLESPRDAAFRASKRKSQARHKI